MWALAFDLARALAALASAANCATAIARILASASAANCDASRTTPALTSLVVALARASASAVACRQHGAKVARREVGDLSTS